MASVASVANGVACSSSIPLRCGSPFGRARGFAWRLRRSTRLLRIAAALPAEVLTDASALAVGCPEARLSHPRIQRSYALYPPGVCDRLGCILPLPPSETRTFVGLDDECLESFCKAEGRANELRLDSTLRASNNYAYGVLLRQPVCAVPQGARDHPEPRASCCPSPHSQQRREGSTALLALLCGFFSHPPTPSTADSKVLRPSSAS